MVATVYTFLKGLILMAKAKAKELKREYVAGEEPSGESISTIAEKPKLKKVLDPAEKLPNPAKTKKVLKPIATKPIAEVPADEKPVNVNEEFDFSDYKNTNGRSLACRKIKGKNYLQYAKEFAEGRKNITVDVLAAAVDSAGYPFKSLNALGAIVREWKIKNKK